MHLLLLLVGDEEELCRVRIGFPGAPSLYVTRHPPDWASCQPVLDISGWSGPGLKGCWYLCPDTDIHICIDHTGYVDCALLTVFARP